MTFNIKTHEERNRRKIETLVRTVRGTMISRKINQRAPQRPKAFSLANQNAILFYFICDWLNEVGPETNRSVYFMSNNKTSNLSVNTIIMEVFGCLKPPLLEISINNRIRLIFPTAIDNSVKNKLSSMKKQSSGGATVRPTASGECSESVRRMSDKRPASVRQASGVCPTSVRRPCRPWAGVRLARAASVRFLVVAGRLAQYNLLHWTDIKEYNGIKQF